MSSAVDVPWFNNFGEAAAAGAGASAGALPATGDNASMSTLSAVDKISACSLVSPSMTRCASSGALLSVSGGASGARPFRSTKSMHSAGGSSPALPPQAAPPRPSSAATLKLPPSAQPQPPQQQQSKQQAAGSSASAQPTPRDAQR